MHFSGYDVLFSRFFLQHVAAAIVAIFRMTQLLHEGKGTNVVTCVAVAQWSDTCNHICIFVSL
jgi:hypothetical protein